MRIFGIVILAVVTGVLCVRAYGDRIASDAELSHIVGGDDPWHNCDASGGGLCDPGGDMTFECKQQYDENGGGGQALDGCTTDTDGKQCHKVSVGPVNNAACSTSTGACYLSSATPCAQWLVAPAGATATCSEDIGGACTCHNATSPTNMGSKTICGAGSH